MRGDLERIFAALHEARVRYLVVGGVAVVLHGVVRLTQDLDLVVQLEPNNLGRALESLTELGYQPRLPVPARQFADPAIRRRWIEEKNMLVFSFWHPNSAFSVDLFVEEPFDFDEVYERARAADLGGVPVSVVPIAELMEMKRNSGRGRDLVDLEELEHLTGSESQ